MVVEEYPYINEKGEEDYKRIKHYSDSKKKILQSPSGFLYSEAIDLYPCKYTYTESTEDIEEDTEEAEDIDIDAVALDTGALTENSDTQASNSTAEKSDSTITYSA